MASISLDNPTVQTYIFYSAILALKMLFLGIYTGLKRGAKGVYANPEDVASRSNAKIKFDDPDVERVRRAHLNDLENIPAFWVLGALYASTGPAAAWAALLFRAYAAGRVLHTLVYAVRPLPQPARALAYLVPYLIMWYMGIQVVLYYLTAM